MFSICDNLFGRSQDLPLPPCESNQELADIFNNFFLDKIPRIRYNFKDINVDTSAETMDTTEDPPLSILFINSIPVDYKDILKTVKDTPSKRCEFDPIPMEILKQIIPPISPLIPIMLNSSLEKGIFQLSLKVALLRPLM